MSQTQDCPLAQHYKVTSSDCFFCLTSNQKHKDVHFTTTSKKEKQNILKAEKLEVNEQ